MARTTDRGYDYEHKALRKAKLAALVDGTPCRRCGHPMIHPKRCPHGRCFFCLLELGHPEDAPASLTRNLADHVRPRHGRRELEHRYCNRAAGARLLNRLKATRRQHTRRW